MDDDDDDTKTAATPEQRQTREAMTTTTTSECFFSLSLVMLMAQLRKALLLKIWNDHLSLELSLRPFIASALPCGLSRLL